MNKNAELILSLVNESHDHLTAEQIYLQTKERGAKMSLSTVYNNLASLYKQGLIHKVVMEGCPDRYDRAVRHDHLVCKRCGKLSDVTLEDLTARIEREVGMPILSYDLRINYLCDECRQAEEAQAAARQEKETQNDERRQAEEARDDANRPAEKDGHIPPSDPAIPPNVEARGR